MPEFAAPPDFPPSGPGRAVRAAGWYFRTYANWPSVVAHRLLGTPLTGVRLRDGRSFRWSDARLGMAVFTENLWQRPYTRSLGAIPANGTVLDLGATIGTFSVFAGTELVPAGHLVAVEPNPACLPLLAANLKANHIVAEIVPSAVSPQSGRVDFWICDSHPSESACFAPAPHWPYQDYRKVSVEAVALGALVERYGPVDLLKMDIEGAEHALLWDVPASVWSGISRLGMEYHLGLGTGYPSENDPDQIVRQLQRLGFEITEHRPQVGADILGYLAAQRPACR